MKAELRGQPCGVISSLPPLWWFLESNSATRLARQVSFYLLSRLVLRVFVRAGAHVFWLKSWEFTVKAMLDAGLTVNLSSPTSGSVTE